MGWEPCLFTMYAIYIEKSKENFWKCIICAKLTIYTPFDSTLFIFLLKFPCSVSSICMPIGTESHSQVCVFIALVWDWGEEQKISNWPPHFLTLYRGNQPFWRHNWYFVEKTKIKLSQAWQTTNRNLGVELTTILYFIRGSSTVQFFLKQSKSFNYYFQNK